MIITDSEYVTKHATSWLRVRAERGWKISSEKPVANRDLWEQLSEKMSRTADGGCEVSF